MILEDEREVTLGLESCWADDFVLKAEWRLDKKFILCKHPLKMNDIFHYQNNSYQVVGVARLSHCQYTGMSG